MIKKKIWKVQKPNIEALQLLSDQLKIDSTMAMLLVNRGICDLQSASTFLNPKLTDLQSPFLIDNLGKAVERILQVIGSKGKIYIYGDYDVDGITSTALLTQTLKYLNADVKYYIPDRIEEGYGLNKETIQFLKQQGAELIITVDCGISARDEIIYGQSIGLEFIVTDHHQPPEHLPPCLIINPALEKRSVPWKYLSGVGVAFKLAQGLWEKAKGNGFSDNLYQLLDLVALGTVADIVPLLDENRILTKFGLEEISKGKRLGLKALCQCAGINNLDEVSSASIGYILAPRLNACGRIGNANLAVQLLLTSNWEEALEIADSLNKENQNRQNIEGAITKEAIEIVEKMDLNKTKVIVLVSDNWHQGVIGIVASRLVERYYRPTIILTKYNGLYKGSGRSIPGFHLHKALTSCRDLLDSFGGHSQAAGLSLSRENIDGFKEKLNSIAQKILTEKELTPLIHLDGEINLAEVNFDFLAKIDKLEPFGCGNPEPVLIYRRGIIKDSREVGSKGGHLKLKIKAGSSYWDGIGFNLAGYLELAAGVEPIDIAFTLDKNSWNGKTSLQLILKDLKLSSDFDDPDNPPSFLERLFIEGEKFLKEDIYKDITKKDCFYTKVVGVTYENRQDLIAEIKKDAGIQLRREQGNVYDPNAIAVLVDNKHIGYLKKDLAKHLAKSLDEGINYQGFVTQITGGKDQYLGVNIFLQKNEQENSPEENEALERRRQLEKVSSERLMEIIRNSIIGSNSYREKQKETLDNLARGSNILAILGTGRGKSAIFQTWSAYLALKKKKVTIIVYPLRALVNDQYQSIKSKLSPLGLNIIKATGALEPEERIEFFRGLEENSVDIILTTPEFLYYNSDKFKKISHRIALGVVDECHHLASRRNGYKLLPGVLKNLNIPQILAVTATLDSSGADLVRKNLAIDKVIIDKHIRENLNLIDARGYHDKIGYIKKIIFSQERTVVYVNSRKKAYALAADLRRDLPQYKEKIGYYHGGLSSADRQGIENLFKAGSLQLIVTTSAFGEGIDIPDIQNVVLYHLSFSKEEYNQLAGRAGRNGLEAKIHLLYGPKDKELNQLLLAGVAPEREELAKFYLMLKKLAAKTNPLSLSNSQLAEWASIYKIFGAQDKTIGFWLGIFEELELIEREGHGNNRVIYIKDNPSKVELEKSLRYLEGREEKNTFQEFVKIAFRGETGELLRLINQPIFPEGLIKE